MNLVDLELAPNATPSASPIGEPSSRSSPWMGWSSRALAPIYALTSSRWHLDAPPPSSARAIGASLWTASIKLAVLGQLACTAIATTTFRRLAVRNL